VRHEGEKKPEQDEDGPNQYEESTHLRRTIDGRKLYRATEARERISLKIPSWEGKEGFSLRSGSNPVATSHLYTSPAEGIIFIQGGAVDGMGDSPLYQF